MQRDCIYPPDLLRTYHDGMIPNHDFPNQFEPMGSIALDATGTLPRRGCIGEFSRVIDLRSSCGGKVPCGDSESAVENASAGGGNVSRSPLAFSDGKFGAPSRVRTSGA